MLESLLATNSRISSRAQNVRSDRLQADEEPRLPRIPLPAGSTTQLIVDTATLMTVRPDHVKTTQLHDRLSFRFVAASKSNVRSATCHIGGDGYGAESSGLSNDLGFLIVVGGVQHTAGDHAMFQHLGQAF